MRKRWRGLALFAAGLLLIAGCGDSKVTQKDSESKADSAAVAEKEVKPAADINPVADAKPAEVKPKAEAEPNVSAKSNVITMEDFKGFLPDDPVESVELTETEKQFATMGPPPSDGGKKIKGSGFLFETPVRLKGGDEYVKVDQPGYACPTLADLNGDGKEELIVGQFSQGKMRMFENVSTESDSPMFGEESWIMTGKKPAEVPGVW